MIGEAVCRRLAREGGIVVGIDRETHSGLINIEADLAVESEVTEVLRRSIGRPAASTSSITIPVSWQPTTSRRSRRAQTYLTASSPTTFERLGCAVNTASEYMLKAERPQRVGHQLRLAFLAGMGAASAQMAYNAAKAAVTQLSRDLGTHLARQGIRVMPSRWDR